MSEERPVSKTITWVCENCGGWNHTHGSTSFRRFMKLLRAAICTHCGTPREPSAHAPVPDRHFRCIQCGIVYRRRKNWTPIENRCRTCYVRNRRDRQRKNYERNV